MDGAMLKVQFCVILDILHITGALLNNMQACTVPGQCHLTREQQSGTQR
jgi:hypothetical protein